MDWWIIYNTTGSLDSLEEELELIKEAQPISSIREESLNV